MRNAWCTMVVTLLLAALPVNALAQEAEEDPPVLRLSWFMCDLSGDNGEAVQNEIDNEDMVVWKEIVAENDAIMDYGYVYHWWADEWNVGIYTIATSLQAILDAEEEAGERLEERFGESPSAFGQACPHHRDGFYTMGPSASESPE